MNKFMNIAFNEACKSHKKGDVPVGAVIVCNDKVISKSHNNRQKKHSVLGHAEINAIIKAEKKLKDWRLDNCDLYVTLYPCEMCDSIIKESRINNVYYLVNNNKIIKNNIKYIQTNDCINIKNKYENMVKNFFEKLRK